MNWGDYIVYVDESGDHSLASIDPDYPIFVLACCVFKKIDYLQVTAQFQQFKFNQWGHDIVVLHEREIRQSEGMFGFLFDQGRRTAFLEELNSLIETTPLTLIASIIDKSKLSKSYLLPDNPYELALKFCLERLWFFLQANGQSDKTTHFVVESRGKKEDIELELAFRRIGNGENHHQCHLPIQLVFSKKDSNAVGLQLADLVARPIGRHYLNSTQINRAYNLIQSKFYQSRAGEIIGYGLKCFP